MLKKRLSILFLFLLTGLFVTGCATPKTVALSTTEGMPFCQSDVSGQFTGVSTEKATDLLRRAENDGCWEPAMLSALDAGVKLSNTELVKGLTYFNRQQTQATFNRLIEQYLESLIDGRIDYGEDQRRLLEVYSRQAIRNARSQESSQLKLVQQVSWRLDRPMYAQLFE